MWTVAGRPGVQADPGTKSIKRGEGPSFNQGSGESPHSLTAWKMLEKPGWVAGWKGWEGLAAGPRALGQRKAGWDWHGLVCVRAKFIKAAKQPGSPAPDLL